MDAEFKRLTDFLVRMGVGEVPHTHKSYLAHLVAVHRSLESQGYPSHVCRAGLFHSVYGTERFQGFKLPLDRREEVRALLCDRAERLAYLNCAMDRASFDRALEQSGEPFSVRDRLTGQVVALSGADFDDLCRVHLFDWLEQVPRSRHGWGYRREAYRTMAERLGGKAVAAYDRAFTAEPAAT